MGGGVGFLWDVRRTFASDIEWSVVPMICAVYKEELEMQISK